ncbi:hypothetical protein E3P86_00149 [Wallemia ichthyophaga]|uniref:IQ domain-containing protein IQM6 n=1 Tax=Wallemia ichthyophaga TaxID=245174 RepID=A0A4V4M6Z0_WALIC|nr:hypothetical protein E3P86_00149 [Wallemia ichthyophaga]
MSDEKAEQAAIKIQRNYRLFSGVALIGSKCSSSDWQQQRDGQHIACCSLYQHSLSPVADLKMKEAVLSQTSARRNSATERFQRAGFFASRLHDGLSSRDQYQDQDQDPKQVSAKVQEMLTKKEENGCKEGAAEKVLNLKFISKVKSKKRDVERRLQGRVGPDQKPTQALQEKQSKRLEDQHWLEMIDTKHRYGVNLKCYHKLWSVSGTSDNFFRWLDYGEGTHLDLDECPRERLDKEQIFYCSAEQRLNYLVVPNPLTGLLHWAKNGEAVDTAPDRWQDSGDGAGIIPLQEGFEGGQCEQYQQHAQDNRSSISEDSSVWTSFDSPSSSDDDDEIAQRERDDAYEHAHDMIDLDDKKDDKTHHKYTARGIMDRLLRKTVGKNTWIYVSEDESGNLPDNMFVGIKSTGTFQHSSFLSGGLVSSAGLIGVRNGQITALSPLSGHYRSSINHFKIFLNEMEKQGLNLDKVKVGKSEVMLWGLERYGSISKNHRERKRSASIKIRGLAEKLHITETSETRETNDENKAPRERARQ